MKKISLLLALGFIIALISSCEKESIQKEENSLTSENRIIIIKNIFWLPIEALLQ
ncbi:hypothetical protein [Aquimarina sp. I32.4]|uniref:hypothetical protein n=1 Tax=Aquimarina sp. I32.4 TaxID=2053903 RepID=UPI001304D913|nr:hypothetical protein [Aquimarina sp. I32.4]